MKSLPGVVCLLALAVGTTLHAGEIWDCPCQCCWYGSFEGTAEFLWMRPQGCDPLYVVVDERAAAPGALPSGNSRVSGTGAEPGFRFSIGYLYEGRCDDFRISFTGLWATGDRRAFPRNGGGLWPTVGHPRYLRSRLNDPIGGLGTVAYAQTRARLGYEAVTAEFARRRAVSCHTWLRGSVGVHWARIRDRLDVYYAGTALLSSGTIQEQTHQIFYRNETEGGGPHFGVYGQRDLACGLGLEAQVGVAVLLGQRKIRIEQMSQGETVPEPGPNDFDERLELHFRSTCTAFPEFEARLGLTYHTCCGRCHAFLFAIGYEWASYVNALGSIRFNDTGGTNHTSCTSFNLSGLYVSARITI